MNIPYSFQRDSVAKLFRQALKAGLELPECKRPEESKHSGDPNYCPYHRIISHPIEDCYVVGKEVQNGRIHIIRQRVSSS